MTIKPIEYTLCGLVMAMSQAISLIIGLVLYVLFPQVPFIWGLIPVLYVMIGVSLVYKNIAKINDSRI